MPFTYPYPRMLITVDVVVLMKPINSSNVAKLLLIERGNDPFKGNYALPGGFPETDELLADAAARELQEETGIKAPSLQPIGVFDSIGRDPRDRNISIAFGTTIDEGSQHPTPGDDAAATVWVPIDNLPKLAFDHDAIVEKAISIMRSH